MSSIMECPADLATRRVFGYWQEIFSRWRQHGSLDGILAERWTRIFSVTKAFSNAFIALRVRPPSKGRISLILWPRYNPPSWRF